MITRHGQPVVEIKAIAQAARAITPADVDWVATRRVAGKAPKTDAGTLVSQMRDGEWQR